MAAGQQGDQQALEHRVLADDHALDLVERVLERLAWLVVACGSRSWSATRRQAGLSPADNGGRVTTLGGVRVLVAEDERRVADAVARGLRREGMAVDVAYDGANALYKARVYAYDVVVLDRDLPGLHGDEVCRTLRDEQPDSRVLMLTAAVGRRRPGRRPLARRRRLPVEAVRLRRAGRAAAGARPPRGPGAPARRCEPATSSSTPPATPSRAAARPVELTPKEFAVLEVLHGGRRRGGLDEELLERVWDENADPFTNTVRMTVLRLRRKLGDPPLIETVKGAGYRV